RFEVLEGRMRAIVDGEERVYSAGESFEVPAGTPHQRPAVEPATMRWEVRRALRTAEFFERLYGDGPDRAREMGEAFFAEFADVFRLPRAGGWAVFSSRRTIDAVEKAAVPRVGEVAAENEEATEPWSGVLFDRFVEYRELIVLVVGEVGKGEMP